MFTYIDTIEKSKEACSELSQEKELGIDLECENNLHHYGVYLSIIQISSIKKNYIIDFYKLKGVPCLKEIFESPKIVKIFHDVDFDFRVLNKEMNCRPKNVFDTMIAAFLLGKERVGLGDLLKEYFNVEKVSKFQMADWTKRPLTAEMLSYAMGDTVHLIKLVHFLRKELSEKGRLSWAEEDFKVIESKEWEHHLGTFEGLKGIKEISDTQRAIAKRLYDLRERLAQKVDRPIHFIFNNKRLIEFSLRAPNWKNVTGVHPIVRREWQSFKEAVEKGREEKYEIEIPDHKKFNQKQKEEFALVQEVQSEVAKQENIPKHLIMNKDQMIEIVISKKLDCLKNWQRNLVKKRLADVLGISSSV